MLEERKKILSELEQYIAEQEKVKSQMEIEINGLKKFYEMKKEQFEQTEQTEEL